MPVKGDVGAITPEGHGNGESRLPLFEHVTEHAVQNTQGLVRVDGVAQVDVNLASSRIGSNNSTGLPDGSSTRICLPPTPVTMSFRKWTPFLRNVSTSA